MALNSLKLMFLERRMFMRIYGIHSGRNNMSKLIARSIMYNSPKKQKYNKTNSDASTSILVYIIAFIIVALLFIR